MGRDDESDGIERLVEVFRGDAWSGGTTAPEDMIGLCRLGCEARGRSALPVSAADVEAIRARIRELEEDSRALAVGESMRLEP